MRCYKHALRHVPEFLAGAADTVLSKKENRIALQGLYSKEHTKGELPFLPSWSSSLLRKLL